MKRLIAAITALGICFSAWPADYLQTTYFGGTTGTPGYSSASGTTIDTSNGIRTKLSVTADGGVAASALSSTGDVTITLDSDNNGSNSLFIKDGGGTTRWTITEAGNVTTGGTLTVTGGIVSTAIGATGASTGAFTTLSASSTSTLAAINASGNVVAQNGNLLSGVVDTTRGDITAFGSSASSGGRILLHPAANDDDFTNIWILSGEGGSGNFVIQGNGGSSALGTILTIDDATGNGTFAKDWTITGDLAVNGGDFTSTQTTFNLLNATPTTINFGGAGTALTIGSTTGTTTIRNANTAITGDLAISGGDITSTVTTMNVFNATATTVNAFGAATTLTMGANGTGTITLRNGNTAITGNASLTGALNAMGDASTDIFGWVGRCVLRQVTDAGPMTATAGTQGEIVYNTSDSKFYGCTVTGSPATWAALN